eukprot:CAMPEP_0117474662 /NCGR_PEP_ID=MMETSP0784-20121206/9399_1 /TAXON_ID=39447 /ORGANISM="" /LENGTH=85 /DNA_ID=CAMNT_0005268893 /DNA_START=863 /DNA_END=1117 /DNA_ORIENTATION=-
MRGSEKAASTLRPSGEKVTKLASERLETPVRVCKHWPAVAFQIFTFPLSENIEAEATSNAGCTTRNKVAPSVAPTSSSVAGPCTS